VFFSHLSSAGAENKGIFQGRQKLSGYCIVLELGVRILELILILPDIVQHS
jgi:hypothetical protein